MSKIRFINEYGADTRFSYDDRIRLLRDLKVKQTQEKAAAGGANEDDYGLIVQNEYTYQLRPSHPNGSIYGYKAWRENYIAILDTHPLYVNPLDAFVGKGFLFLERLRPKDKKWNPDFPFDALQKEFTKYGVISGIDNCHHFTPAIEIGFELGWGGILEKLKTQKALHDESHALFYESEIMVVEAIIRFLHRMGDELEALSKEERNPQLKENLLEMSRMNHKLAAGKPETFKEAVQWMCWFSMLSRTYNRGSAGGQLDEMLRPYYERDAAAGILTDDEAVFYMACLFLQDSRYFQLGGPDAEGNDTVSHLSYLALDAADKINIACNLTIRVHDRIDPVFMRKSVECLLRNQQGWPRYSSDTTLMEGFMRCGYSRELARRRVAAGCHWMCIPGMEYTMNDTVKINLAKVFEVAWNEFCADGTGQKNVDALFARFEKHLKRAVDATGNGIMHHLKYQHMSQPELILNLFQYGLIEKGVNVTRGGTTYYNMCVDGSGLAVVADSFAACEQRIDKEGKLTYERLKRLLDSDYEGLEGERMRQLMYHSERFGGGDTRGDYWARRVNEVWTRLVRDLVNQHPGINFIPGYFSWSNTIMLGKMVGATPNGRKAHEPISHGANPNSGFRTDGAVTAMCNSIASIQPGYGNTAPVQLELDPTMADTPEGVDKMLAMIRGILDSGNTLLNINLINTEKILEADKDPSRYPDLVVRVTGFTAFFSMLSPEFRQLVVERVKAVNCDAVASLA